MLSLSRHPARGSSTRLAEMEALEIIDAEAFEQRGFLVGAHPFGDRLQIEVLGEVDQRAHEDLVVGRLRQARAR